MLPVVQNLCTATPPASVESILVGKRISLLAVIIPTESMFVTSSYVSVPPIETLPPKLALDAVSIPDAFMFLAVISPVVM